jgi:hypothetical protein
MKNVGYQLIIGVMAVSFCLGGCTKKPPSKTKEQVIQEKLDERFERWKADLEQRCLDQAMDKAIAIVDSTIIANARLNRDTAGKPVIPMRPEKPTFVIPKDSTPVKPLLKKRQDTLQNN